MHRILQLGSWLLVLTTLLTPVSEMLDRWDAPGLAHDTEMHLFAVVLMLGLALLVARLISSAVAVLLALVDRGPSVSAAGGFAFSRSRVEALLPQTVSRGSPPLRI